MKQILSLILLYLFHRTYSSSSSSQPLLLDENALQQLSLKGFYQTHRTFDNTARGVYVQDISVPSSVVWDCLLLDANDIRRKAVQVFDVQMSFKSWFRTWRGRVHCTFEPAHQTLTFQTNELPQSTSVIGTWRVYSISESSSTRVSLVVDQTPSSWFSSSWVNSILSQSTRSLIQCMDSPARQQQRRATQGLVSNRNNNKHQSKVLEESFIPVASQVEPPIGFKRYGLVSTVFVLAFYNIHLCFSQ